MYKEIIKYISIIIVCTIAGIFIGSGTNNNIESRVFELTRITEQLQYNYNEIGKSVKSIESSIDSIKPTVNSIAGRIESSENRSIRIENGISRIEKINYSNIESIGQLINGNKNIENTSNEFRELNKRFGEITKTIGERNKLIEDKK